MTIHIQMLFEVAKHARELADAMQAIADDCAAQIAMRKAAGETDEAMLDEVFGSTQPDTSADMTPYTGKVRASFVHVFEPAAINGGEPKYSCSLIIPKSDTVTIGKIREAVEQAKQEGIPKWGGKLPPNLKLPLRDGDVDRPDDPAYENSYFINATSQEQPGVVDRRKVKITDPLAIYSGCYIRASINIYPFNANGNRGIAAGLSNIQFWEDGEPLNGRVRAEDEFDALDVEDDEDFLN